MTEVTTRAEEPGTLPAAGQPMSVGQRLLWIGPTGLVVAAGLSVVEWLLVRSPENNGSIAAAALALTMTLPVALVRRFPVQAAALIAVAALVNGLVFDDLVRCAGAFPAALYVAFAVGARARTPGRSWGPSIVGLALVMGCLVAQWIWDPALNVGPAFLGFALPLAAACWGAGIGWAAFSHRRTSR